MKMFQIYEIDLEALERELPLLMDIAQTAPGWNENPLAQKAWEQIKKTLSDVRWNYGPPKSVERIDTE